MRKIEQKNWLTKGFSILESEGFVKITIDNLCAELQVTKDEFYYHFKNIDSYTEALMNLWIEEYTTSIIHQVKSSTGKKHKKKMMDLLTINFSSRLEHAVRVWGYMNEIVKKYVLEADQTRLKFLIDLNLEEGKDYTAAKNEATLIYATLIGIQQLFSEK